jgi:IS30 family transposase
MERESLEQLLEQGFSLEEIGRRFGKHGATISYWMKRYGLQAANREKHAARGGIERARLETLVDDGMTIAELAGELG